jgi:hypothetical protein
MHCAMTIYIVTFYSIVLGKSSLLKIVTLM